MKLKNLRLISLLAACVFIAAAVAHGQEHEPSASVKGFSVKLGDKVIALPAPEGFEEVAGQFERIKTRFAATEPPESDLLAVYMSISDRDLLRDGQAPGYVRYTKVSVVRATRTYVVLPSDFAGLVDYVRKNNATIFSPSSEKIGEVLSQVDKQLTKELSKDVTIKYTQNVNLGDFDNRPNVYSDLLLLFYKAQMDGKETETPVLAAVSLVLVKQRVIMVFAYKRYETKADTDALKQFSTSWINQILAAN